MLRRFRSYTAGIRDFAIDTLFPSKCVCCATPVHYSDDEICGKCRNGIQYVSNGCERCGGIVVDGRCSVCGDRMFYLTRNIVIAEYSGIMEKTLVQYKFMKRRRLSRYLGQLCFSAIEKSMLSFDCITAVPLSRSKKWKRGFNQSELIARMLSRKTGIQYAELLRENGGANVQKRLGRKDRFINVLNRYGFTGRECVEGRAILIVDDVFTTGATLNECARVLAMSGAARIYSLTVARAGIKKLENMAT